MIRIKRFKEDNKVIEMVTKLLYDYRIYHFVKQKGFLDRIIYKESKSTRIAEYKVYEGKDVIIIYDSFIDHYNKYGEDAAKEVLLHEIGHAFLAWYGLSNLMKMGYKYNIDVFDTTNLPFGENNFDEAFSQMVSLIIMKDKKVKSMYPVWYEMINNILKESMNN